MTPGTPLRAELRDEAIDLALRQVGEVTESLAHGFRRCGYREGAVLIRTTVGHRPSQLFGDLVGLLGWGVLGGFVGFAA